MGVEGFRTCSGDHVTDSPRFVMPDPGSPARIAFPPIVRGTLSNQARVWSIRQDTVPVVTIVLMVPAGSAHDPASSPGMAGVMADLLDVQRPRLTEALERLRKRGISTPVRGVIVISDREILEHSACSCYGLLRTYASGIVDAGFGALNRPSLLSGRHHR